MRSVRTDPWWGLGWGDLSIVAGELLCSECAGEVEASRKLMAAKRQSGGAVRLQGAQAPTLFDLAFAGY